MKTAHHRVLVVDDNPADRLIYRMALHGYEVFDAAHGQAGLDFCDAQIPDCILLDFNMPGMHGLRFIELLKERYGDLPCAIVMLTGVRDESIAVQAMKSGTTDYLSKSENLGEILVYAVAGAIEKFRMREQIAKQQLALEASERQYRTLMEALPQLVWLANPAGRIQYANRHWREYTGLASPGEFSLLDALPTGDRDRFYDVWREATRNERSIEIELRIHEAPVGIDCWHLVRLVPIQNQAAGTFWIGTAANIEVVKQA